MSWAPCASPAPAGQVPRGSPYLAPVRGPRYDSTAEEYRATRIPEQTTANRSSSQKSGLRESPMQPRPAGVPSAAVPGGGERPGCAGPDSRSRLPGPAAHPSARAAAAPSGSARRVPEGRMKRRRRELPSPRRRPARGHREPRLVRALPGTFKGGCARSGGCGTRGDAATCRVGCALRPRGPRLAASRRPRPMGGAARMEEQTLTAQTLGGAGGGEVGGLPGWDGLGS